MTVKRGLDVRDFTLTTFGGSGSLLLCRLVDILGLPAVLVPPDPGNVSAFGLLTVDVRNDYVRTAVSLHDHLDVAATQDVLAALTEEADAALAREGFAEAERRFVRTADLRYFGQAFEVRVAVARRPARRRRCGRRGARVPRRAPGVSTATTSRATPTSRSSGSTCGSPGSARSSGPTSSRHERRSDDAADPDAAPAGCASTRPTATSPRTSTGARDLQPGDRLPGPGRRRGVRVDGAGAPRLRRRGRRLPQPRGAGRTPG